MIERLGYGFLNLIIRARLGGARGRVHFQPGRLVAAGLGNLYESLWLSAVLRMLG